MVGQRVVRVEIGRGRGRKGGRVGGEGNDWARREGEWEGEVRMLIFLYFLYMYM